MDCLAGTAALGATGVYRYNRDNFFYDRKLRLKAELKLQDFRISQAKLWREDIRDLISLSEYKMHVYLLVNVLLLGHTIVIWCQGKLPWNTPDWLMAGEVISTSGAMMCLLLSIWMAMHAAVAAQSYEARLLTQLVRLPIPSWNEVEACRTNASDFEKLRTDQMFRVPWAMGWQEQRAQRAAAAAAAGAEPPAAESAGEEGDLGADTMPADPWGLERSGDDLDDLGVKLGADVAHLRHVKIARQAMVHWQSYDAFARISMSVGVNQLLLAMSYYILGYVLVEVGTRDAAACGVVLLSVVSATLLRLDMSLSAMQLRILQCMQGLGPLASTIAAYWWSDNSHGSSRIAEACSVVAFFAHGCFIGMMTMFARVEPVGDVVVLPRAFSSVLYLDVFGWVRSQTGGLSGTAHPVHPGGAGEGSPTEAERSRRPSALPMQRGGDEPGLLRRPEDLRPPGAVHDMSGVDGAPTPVHSSGNPRERDEAVFFDADSWLQWDGNDDAVTGHGGESPRIVPWHIFRVSAWSLCAAWFIAGFYHLYSVWTGWDFQVSARLEEAFAQLPLTGSLRTAMLLERGHSDVSWRMSLEEVGFTWPASDVHPRTLACDAAGEHFIASDGLFAFAAQAPNAVHNASVKAPFKRLACPLLEGEGLQDAMVTCKAGRCQGLALHRHGRRVSGCALPGAPLAAVADFAANVSDAWLERLREAPADVQRDSGSHARLEKVVAIAHDVDCGDAPGLSANHNGAACVLLGTTHGRVVQTSHSDAASLVPSEILVNTRAFGELRPGSMRAFGGAGLAALQENGRMIVLADAATGSVAARLVLPERLVASSFCAGGGFVFLLSRGPEPKVWRFRAPSAAWAPGHEQPLVA